MASSSKLKNLSGYPEWSPDQRLVEREVMATLGDWFERFGFVELATRSVEPVAVLKGQGGDADKEIYGLRRLAAEGPEREQLGLRFDLTVPLARYTAQNRGQLRFPFKRYQIQPVWRGERPQKGRFREFVQADLDVVADGELPLRYDAELAELLLVALAQLPIPPIRLRINNRKLMEGAYRALGIDDVVGTLRAVDKLEKTGRESVIADLTGGGVEPQAAARVVALADIQVADSDALRAAIGETGLEGELLAAGLDELCAVLDQLRAAGERLGQGEVVADLSIARGLDYYTGTIYEGQLVGSDVGTVCAGGRYDDLVGSLTSNSKLRLPGVGVSIGLTRLLAACFDGELLATSRPTPLCVWVTLPSEERRGEAEAIAWALRERGICADVSPTARKFGKQIAAAEARGVPFVWFLADDRPGRVKDIRSGQETEADPASWLPPDEDLRPQLVAGAQAG